MPRFFVENIEGDRAYIMGEDARHIGRSLRMRLGDEITLCRNGFDYISKILTISDEEVVCEVVEYHESKAEPNLKLTLFQALPKADKLELIIQKCVEIGVCEIVPVLTSRCVSRPDRKSFEKKLARLEKISLEAAKQSGRGIIPKISQMIDLNECLDRMSQMKKAIVCYEKGGVRIDSKLLGESREVGVLIGSEGGFDESEIEKARAKGVVPVWLGERILRCETAPIAAAAVLLHESGDL